MSFADHASYDVDLDWQSAEWIQGYRAGNESWRTGKVDFSNLPEEFNCHLPNCCVVCKRGAAEGITLSCCSRCKITTSVALPSKKASQSPQIILQDCGIVTRGAVAFNQLRDTTNGCDLMGKALTKRNELYAKSTVFHSFEE